MISLFVPAPAKTAHSGSIGNSPPEIRVSNPDETPISFKIPIRIDSNPFMSIILDFYCTADTIPKCTIPLDPF